MNHPELTPGDAAVRLDQDSDCIYLDVRTPEEFSQGHAPGAWNIPIFLADPASGQMTPNPEFTLVCQAVLPPETPMVVGCASGIRSQQAIVTLSDFGYDQLSNLRGGFSGRRTPSGELITPGWADSGLPTETGDGGEHSWASLRRR